MAFDSLSDRLNKTIRNIAGKGKLTDDNMESMLKEVRLALLEADVNYKIVKDFLNDVREKSRGEDVINSVQPGEMLVKIVHDELVNLLGNEEAELHFKESGITTIMMVGLQGTGKTTSVGKIARIFKTKLERNPLLIAADVIRPAAIDQLKTLGKEIDTEVFSLGTETSALDTVKAGMKYAKENGFDTVFIDTAGRLHIDEELMDELVNMINSKNEENQKQDKLQAEFQMLCSEFIESVRTTGKVTSSNYDKIQEKIKSTNDTFNVETEIKVLEETNQSINGEIPYSSTKLNIADTHTLREGDIISITITNSANQIIASYSGMVIVNGK